MCKNIFNLVIKYKNSYIHRSTIFKIRGQKQSFLEWSQKLKTREIQPNMYILKICNPLSINYHVFCMFEKYTLFKHFLFSSFFFVYPYKYEHNNLVTIWITFDISTSKYIKVKIKNLLCYFFILNKRGLSEFINVIFFFRVICINFFWNFKMKGILFLINLYLNKLTFFHKTLIFFLTVYLM